MQVKMTSSCRYADPSGPHLPQIDFVEASVVTVSEVLGESILSNGHGTIVANGAPETAVVEPESKDDGLEIESKDEAPSSKAYDNLSPKKQRYVDEYLIDRDETLSAIRAGYSENTAEKRGTALLEDAGVVAAIAEKTQ